MNPPNTTAGPIARVLHVLVQPILVLDDGNELSPGPGAEPVAVPLSDLAGLAEKIRTEVDALNKGEPAT